jgi:hypothetical protein
MFKAETKRLRCRLDEYTSYVAESRQSVDSHDIDEETLLCKLEQDGEWTHQAANLLLELTREYGAFVLGNAYALAKALGCEDGSAGL